MEKSNTGTDTAAVANSGVSPATPLSSYSTPTWNVEKSSGYKPAKGIGRGKVLKKPDNLDEYISDKTDSTDLSSWTSIQPEPLYPIYPGSKGPHGTPTPFHTPPTSVASARVTPEYSTQFSEVNSNSDENSNESLPAFVPPPDMFSDKAKDGATVNPPPRPDDCWKADSCWS